MRKNPHAVALGRLGGLRGGTGRASKLPPERRSEIARNAAKARWRRVGGTEPEVLPPDPPDPPVPKKETDR